MVNAKVFGVIIVGLICIAAIYAIALPAKTATVQYDSAGAVVDKTYDADNAIYNYEWFKTRYEEIGASERQIQNTINEIDSFKETFGDASEWDWQTKSDYSRLTTIKLGQVNHYESLVAEYNARSKMANRNVFEDKLPMSVDKILW